MNTNYSIFNYNTDFIPSNNVFNINSIRGNVGIGTTKPTHFLEIIGNCSTTQNFLIKGNLNFNTTTYSNSLLSQSSSGQLFYLNLNSSKDSETGITWSILNNNNINLTFRDINDNTRLDYFSSIYSVSNKIIITPHSNLTLRYIFITDNSNNTINIDLNDYYITINGITSYITKKLNGLYKLNNYIHLNPKVQNIINLHNFNSTYNIQFYGLYNYYAGSLWTQENNLYINHNIGIYTNNPLSTLHVIGDSHFMGNLTVKNTLSSNSLITNNIKLNGLLNTKHIESLNNNFIINPDKSSIGIGIRPNSSNLLTIGNYFKITNNNIYSNNCNISNNISLSSITNNIYTILPNTNELYFKKNNQINNIYSDTKKNITISNNLSISFTNTTNDKLYINGNSTIIGNLTSNSITNKMFLNKEYANHLNTNEANIDNIIINGFSFTDILDSNNITINKDFILPSNSIKNSIYYDTTKNKFMIYYNHKFYELFHNYGNDDLILNSFYDIGSKNFNKITSQNSVITNFLHSDFINTKILEITNNNIFSNNANIYFNTNSLREEIIINDNLSNTTMFNISY
jgi:hypothetical protein